MNYLRIYESDKPPVIGKYFPQAAFNDAPTDIWDNNYIGSFYLTKAPENVSLPTARLKEGAVITDLVSCVGVGFSSNLLVSSRLKELLKASYYSGMQFFDTTLFAEAKVFDYALVHPHDCAYEILDYNKTEFYKIVDVLNSEDRSQKLSFKNAGELRKALAAFRKENAVISINNISVKEESVIDFFALSFVPGGIGFFLSEKLADSIEKSGCTGLMFKDVNNSSPFNQV